jgi:hypothetical protein
MRALYKRATAIAGSVTDGNLQTAAMTAMTALTQSQQWLLQTEDAQALQVGARRWALSVGRAYELLLLVEQAQWELLKYKQSAVVVSAQKFAATLAG